MTQALPLPDACAAALAAVEADPLLPGAPAEAHLAACPACAEARVAFLAQEEISEPLAPAGYFERLPDRILRKLPARPPLSHHIGLLGWAAAAALLMAVGTGAFLAGRANRTPLVEATLPRAQEAADLPSAETPFHDREEDAAQVQALTPDEMKVLLQRLDQPAPTTAR